MASMFDSYDNLSKNYIPSNMNFKKNEAQTSTSNKPYEEVNELGEVVSYFWYEGDTVDLAIDLYGELTVDSNTIVQTIKDIIPNEQTIGTPGVTYYYNSADDIWWVCSSIESSNEGTTYNWVETTEPSTPQVDTVKNVYIALTDWLSNKQIKVTLANFRWEIIDTQLFDGATSITYQIGEELASKLTKGTYHLSVIVLNTETTRTVYQNPDIVCMVK